MIIDTPKKAVVILKCEDCGKERSVQRNTAIMAKKEHPCRVCSNKRNGLLKRGRPASRNADGRFQSKAQYCVYGTEYIDHSGYVQVYVGYEEAARHGRKDKFVRKHRMVAQNMLGRSLNNKEVVHHIDGDKINNSENNLYVFPNLSAHRDSHNSLEAIAFQLVTDGLIKFNNETGLYERA